MEHSKYIGGSSAERVIACPASVKLCENIPQPPENEWQKMGTALHEAATLCLDTNQLPAAMVGRSFNGVEITEEIVREKLTPAIMACVRLAEEAGGPVELVTEKKVMYCPEKGQRESDIFGTVDLMMRRPGSQTLYVVDFKFGDGVQVEAKDNKQLLFYTGCGIYTKNDDEVAAMFRGVTDFVGAIVQPGNGEGYSTWEYDTERVEKFLDAMEYAIEASESAEPRFKVGDHCRWCRAKASCPEQQKGLEKLSADLPTLAPETIGEWLDRAQQAEGMIKELRKVALMMLESGEKIPGWQMSAKRATRKWTNVDKAKEFLVAHLGDDDAYKKDLISPAQAEKLLGKREFGEVKDKLVSAISTGVTLAREGTGKAPVLPASSGLSMPKAVVDDTNELSDPSAITRAGEEVASNLINL